MGIDLDNNIIDTLIYGFLEAGTYNYQLVSTEDPPTGVSVFSIVLDMGGNPLITGIMTSIASAFAYLTVVASPTCMIIHSTGLISSGDYFKAGWKLFIISVLLLLIISTLYWPILL